MDSNIETTAEQAIEEKNEFGKKIAKWSIIFLLLAALCGLVVSLYFSITDAVVDTAIQSMEELALHDEQTVIHAIELRWNALDRIADECQKANAATDADLIAALSRRSNRIEGCIDMGLVSDDGNVYFSNGLIARRPDITIICDKGRERFVERYAGEWTSVELKRKCLIFGLRLSDFEYDGKQLTHIVARVNMETLADDLKIESYGGKGYSNILDKAGDYIIRLATDDWDIEREDNLFVDFASYKISDGKTPETVKDLMDSYQSFTLQYKDADGVARVMSFTPLHLLKSDDGHDTEWYFVLSINRSVFVKQSTRIIRIVSVVFFGMLLAFGIILLLLAFAHNAKQRAKAEKTHLEKLGEALLLAQQSSRAKTVFLNNMSHDIRTPMNAIIGFTGLAFAKIDDKAQVKDYLEKIEKSSTHLLSLINDVLDMSRIESGKLEIKETPENLNEIINEIRDMVHLDVEAKKHTLQINVNAENTDVYVDRLRINRVLLNLLSNAVKYTPDGGNILVSVMQKPCEESELCAYEISVKDDGMGMSEEFVKTVFEPFTREQTSTVSGIQGTGLGLSITKAIVDTMGGRIDVRSEQGKGSEFTVTVKLRRYVADTEVASQSEECDESSFAGKRLLLVEDNELNREIAAEILDEAGFIIENAENGLEAVKKVETSEPGYFDAVIMDIQMPVMDGYEAARNIRSLANAALANIPIIAMSANALEEDVKASFESGMNAHVGKPIDVTLLMETLKKHVK